MNLLEGVTITAHQRHGDGHGFEVAWPLPAHVRWERCRCEAPRELEYKNGVPVIRDLEGWGQPSFWVYPPAFFLFLSCLCRGRRFLPAAPAVYYGGRFFSSWGPQSWP